MAALVEASQEISWQDLIEDSIGFSFFLSLSVYDSLCTVLCSRICSWHYAHSLNQHPADYIYIYIFIISTHTHIYIDNIINRRTILPPGITSCCPASFTGLIWHAARCWMCPACLVSNGSPGGLTLQEEVRPVVLHIVARLAQYLHSDVETTEGLQMIMLKYAEIVQVEESCYSRSDTLWQRPSHQRWSKLVWTIEVPHHKSWQDIAQIAQIACFSKHCIWNWWAEA